MTSSDPGQVLAFQRIEEKDGRMVVELHFPVDPEKKPTGPVPLSGQVTVAPMLMLWNGEMEVGPLTLQAFRRGIAWGSITGITHIRTLPSYDWIEMKDFSGSGCVTEGDVTYLEKESVAESEDNGEGGYFYPPLSPYSWLRGLSIAWGLVSLIGLMLPSSLGVWALVSASAALGLAVLSMVLNRRPADLCIPFLSVALLAGWVYLEPTTEVSATNSVQVADVSETQKVEAAPAQPEVPPPLFSPTAVETSSLQESQPSLADLPKLEPLKLP